jgi:1-deoxy-D-xylulose 5-phosphate reductoisomerase
MKKRILILGSDTKEGQTIFNFFKEYPKKFIITGLSCCDSENLDLFKKQIKISNATHLLVNKEEDSLNLEDDLKVDSISDFSNISKFTKTSNSDIVVFAMPGIESVVAVLSAIWEYKDICIINWDPILYSGKIIIDEIKNKAVKLYPICLKLYSADMFLNSRNLESLKMVNLIANCSYNLDLSYLKNPKVYSYLEFKDKFICDYKIDLINKMFILNYIYNIKLDKFKFFEQDKPLINIFLTFEDGHSLINSTTSDLNNVLNYYFLDNTNLQKKNLVKYEFLKDINYNLKEIDVNKMPAIKCGIKALEMDGISPILFHMSGQLCLELLYAKKIKPSDVQKILLEVLSNPKFNIKNPDFKTILAIYDKLKNFVYSFAKK